MQGTASRWTTSPSDRQNHGRYYENMAVYFGASLGLMQAPLMQGLHKFPFMPCVSLHRGGYEDLKKRAQAGYQSRRHASYETRHHCSWPRCPPVSISMTQKRGPMLLCRKYMYVLAWRPRLGWLTRHTRSAPLSMHQPPSGPSIVSPAESGGDRRGSGGGNEGTARGR